MSARVLLLVVLAAMLACSRSGDKTPAPAPRGSAVLTTEPAPAEKPVPAGKRAKAGAKPAAAAGKPGAAAAPPIDAGAPEIVEQAELRLEEPEANPYSEQVTLKLTVSPPVKALVLWGAKQIAHLEPGKMDTVITRPRGSGPVDLEIKAEGYLPYHTRLYADRNDKLGVRLYRPEDAPNIFGYKRSAEGRKAEAERAEKSR